METVKHRSVETIWLFNYPSLASLDDCPDRMVWLSQRDLNIIWQATLYIDRWRTRVFTEAHGKIYTMATPDEFSEFQEWVSTMRVRLGEYPMCNELLSGILEQITRLADRDCCAPSIGGGSSGAGLEEAPPSGITSTEEDREEAPPEGFETWEEYDTYKCDMAYYIIGQIITDVATAGLLAASYTSATALAGALVAALFTPIGWAIMIGLAGLALSLFLLGAEVSLLTTFLEGKKDDLVCCMLDGDSVANSISGYSDCISTLVAEDEGISGFSSIAVYLATQYLTTFATVDSFNRLYKKVAYAIPTGNECNCDVEAGEYTVVIGNEDSEPAGNANPIVVTTVNDIESAGNCGSDGREMVITFDAPVDISSVVVVGDFCGVCGGLPLFFAYETFPATGEVYIGNATPQVAGDWINVTVIYFYFDCDANTPIVTINYTLTPP